MEDELEMDYDEEEKRWLQSMRRYEEEGRHDEAMKDAVCPTDEETPDRIVPIPVQPASCCSPPPLSHTLKASGAPQGFMLNGRLVPLLPGGGGAELKLGSHPEGSASGFTSVQIPVTLTVRGPAGTQHINTLASVSATAVAPPPPDNEAEAPLIPIITDVISGEAAEKILSKHNMNLITQQSPRSMSSPPLTPPMALASPMTAPSPRTSRPSASSKLLKGQLEPFSPPDCPVCRSQYRMVRALRGFMCLCSPEIAVCLRKLEHTNKYGWRYKPSKTTRDPQASSRSSRVRVRRSTVHRTESKFLSPVQQLCVGQSNDLSASPLPSPRQDQTEALQDPPLGKLVILVKDFYYGTDTGHNNTVHNPLTKKYIRTYDCKYCDTKLRHNIELMSHMKQHGASEQDRWMDTRLSCVCFRRFSSALSLRSHVEAVHTACDSSATCKICELAFDSEEAFLWHMKYTHKPGEMPYICQVCDFRSSFYWAVWSHFEQSHLDTRNYMCQYCLRVMHCYSSYQQHFAQHKRKHVFGCDKCRLQFLRLKERSEHRLLHHQTHIRPPQLSGLKPGTKVTIRTYCVAGSKGMQNVQPLKVVNVPPAPPTQESPKRKRMESLGPLLSNFSDQRPVGVSRPLCMECGMSFVEFGGHFPSLVRCSLCRFLTCCCRAYANHMIKNHACGLRSHQYETMFVSSPRLLQRLTCVSCTFSTHAGDVMANHLTERPDHCCISGNLQELAAAVPENHHHSSHNSPPPSPPHPPPGVSSGAQGGAFIPIHLLSSGTASTQLSVKPLTSRSVLSSLPAMTIKFQGPEQMPPSAPSPLVQFHLAVVLCSLCNGLSEATRRYGPPPSLIEFWTRQQEGQLAVRKWPWDTEGMAEWLLGQQEQQLKINEEKLLQEAQHILGEESQLLDRYRWAVDLMLHHELGLHHRNAVSRHGLKIDRSFIRSLCAQIYMKNLQPHRVGAMAELSVYVDLDQFAALKPSAFQLFGTPEQTPLFDVVVSGLSDGTFLPPLLFFRGPPPKIPDEFPDNVMLEAQPAGFTDQQRLRLWLLKVWRPRVVEQKGGECLLIVDPHRGHVNGEFLSSLKSVHATVTNVIPPGFSFFFQPLETCIMPVLREFLQTRWSQLMSQVGVEGLGVDELSVTAACWLSEVASMLQMETKFLHRSFSMVCAMLKRDKVRHVRMVRALRDALIQPQEADGAEREEVMKSSTSLRVLFEGDSDPESFHGFEDMDIHE